MINLYQNIFQLEVVVLRATPPHPRVSTPEPKRQILSLRAAIKTVKGRVLRFPIGVSERKRVIIFS
jgi:hypothetical protein